MRVTGLAISFVGSVAGLMLVSAEDNVVYVARATSKFNQVPGLPGCTTGSVQNGDPSKGGSVILSKMTGECTIPWHWHTPPNR